MRTPALALALALVVVGCAKPADPLAGTTECLAVTPPPPDASWKAERPQVRVETSLGNMTLALEREAAPGTAENFLQLASSGFYNETFVHRVIRGFVVQAGDPNTRDDDPTNDGRGSSGRFLIDEFNPRLRHDGPGVLSMANSGPQSGSAQFFLTLAAAPHLDDRHAVFGRLVEGNDTLRALGEVRTDATDRPLELPELRKMTLVDAAPFEERHEVGVHVVVPEKKVEAGRPVTYAVVVQNNGTTRDAIGLTIRAPQGWTCRIDANPIVPSGTAAVVLATLTPARGEGTVTLGFAATSAWNGTASAHAVAKATYAPLGDPVREGERVRAHYAGVLVDGRLFDTSMIEVGEDAAQPKFNTLGGWQAKGVYGPFEFEVGRGVIPGFTKLALTAKEGETVAGRIPWQDAYAESNEDQYGFPLLQRDLVFELQIVDVLS